MRVKGLLAAELVNVEQVAVTPLLADQPVDAPGDGLLVVTSGVIEPGSQERQQRQRGGAGVGPGRPSTGIRISLVQSPVAGRLLLPGKPAQRAADRQVTLAAFVDLQHVLPLQLGLAVGQPSRDVHRSDRRAGRLQWHRSIGRSLGRHGSRGSRVGNRRDLHRGTSGLLQFHLPRGQPTEIERFFRGQRIGVDQEPGQHRQDQHVRRDTDDGPEAASLETAAQPLGAGGRLDRSGHADQRPSSPSTTGRPSGSGTRFRHLARPGPLVQPTAHPAARWYTAQPARTTTAALWPNSVRLHEIANRPATGRDAPSTMSSRQPESAVRKPSVCGTSR